MNIDQKYDDFYLITFMFYVKNIRWNDQKNEQTLDLSKSKFSWSESNGEIEPESRDHRQKSGHEQKQQQREQELIREKSPKL